MEMHNYVPNILRNMDTFNMSSFVLTINLKEQSLTQ